MQMQLTRLRESHFALSLEPATTLFPAGRALLRYRAHNAAALTSPTARVEFLLPPELAPAAEAPKSCEIPALEPGQTFIVDYPAIVATPLENDLEIVVQAALLVAGRDPLGSNIVRARIRSRARFDGPQTTVTLLPTDDIDVVSVSATLHNAGDTWATGVILTLPPPLGTLALDDTDAVFHAAYIGAGQSVGFTRSVRIVDPPGAALVAAGASIVHDHDTAVAIPPSAPLELEPACSPPALSIERDGRCVRVQLRIPNGGWYDARDVAVTLTWPDGFRAAEGSLLVAGCVPQKNKNRAARSTATPRANGVDIVIARVPRRSQSDVSIDLYPTAKAAHGTVRAHVRDGDGDHDIFVAVDALAIEALALRLVDAPNCPVDAGARLRIAFEVSNPSDRSQSFTLALDSVVAVTLADRPHRCGDLATIGAGSTHTILVQALVPSDAIDGSTVAIACTLTNSDGTTRIARAPIVARNRVWIDTARWLLDVSGSPHIALSNRGSSPARDLSVVFDAGVEPLELGDLDAFATVRSSLGDRPLELVAVGGIVFSSKQRVCELLPVPIKLLATWDGAIDFSLPTRAPAGIALALRAAIHLPSGVTTLHVRAIRDPHAAPLAGSTRVNGHAILDAGSEARLFGPGLFVRNVPSDAVVEIDWSVLPDANLTAGGTIATALEIVADGRLRACEADPIGIDVQEAFAARPDSLPFHVEGIAMQSDRAAEPQRASEELSPRDDDSEIEPSSDVVDDEALGWVRAPLVFSLRLDDERCAALARLLTGASMPGFVSHVFSLRALFSEDVRSSDPMIHEALALERDALRSVLDRLYVKMRIPGYDAIAGDCEDLTARRSLLALLRACGNDAVCSELDGLPLGAPAALEAAARFLPQPTGGDGLSLAIASYVEELRAALYRARSLAIGEFEDRLTRGDEPELDRLRTLIVRALEVRDATYA